MPEIKLTKTEVVLLRGALWIAIEDRDSEIDHAMCSVGTDPEDRVPLPRYKRRVRQWQLAIERYRQLLETPKD